MKKQANIDEKHAKRCLEANRHNFITAHYFLLIKKKIYFGEDIESNEESNNF